MAKTSLKQPLAPAPVVDVEVTTDVRTDDTDNQQDSRALRALTATEEEYGQLDNGDYIRPRLTVVQRISELSELYPAGSIILNKDVVLSDGKKPVPMIVLRARKSFVENLPYEPDSEIRPRVFQTVEEVKNVGGTLTYIGDTPPSFKPQADLIVAIEGTDEVVFDYPANGKRYALAAVKFKGMSYTSAAKTVWTVARAVNGNLPSVQFTMTTRSEKTKKGPVFVPILNRAGKVEVNDSKQLLAFT